MMKIYKLHIIRKINNFSIKIHRFRRFRNSIFASFFRKSAKISPSGVPERGEKGAKRGYFWMFFRIKCNFISLCIKQLTKKMQKSEKKWDECDVCNGKILFLQSQTTTIWGARKEGLSTGECSLKEWRNVANTQEIGIWDSQAMRPGQTT